jgi:hypothetical protein
MIDRQKLMQKVKDAPQRYVHVPGRGDTEKVDEFRIVVTAAERDAILAALVR